MLCNSSVSRMWKPCLRSPEDNSHGWPPARIGVLVAPHPGSGCMVVANPGDRRRLQCELHQKDCVSSAAQWERISASGPTKSILQWPRSHSVYSTLNVTEYATIHTPILAIMRAQEFPPDQNAGPTILGLVWSSTGLAAIFVTLRFYDRIFLHSGLGWDVRNLLEFLVIQSLLFIGLDNPMCNYNRPFRSHM